jgi:hypothetical protein
MPHRDRFVTFHRFQRSQYTNPVIEERRTCVKRGVGLTEPGIQSLDLSSIRLCRHAPALRPDRKSSEGRQRLQSRLNVPQIDFGLEKRDLVIERDLVDIDVPGPGSAVAPVTPAVAAPF